MTNTHVDKNNAVKMTTRKWVVRDYCHGDEKMICALFERVFGKQMGATESICHWQWEFLKNPLEEIFIKLAWDDKRLVGQYTASPVRIYAEGRDIIAALSHDTMTDPQYCGLGIFSDTAESLYDDQKKAGHNFVYGFPNRNSIYGFKKKLNWHQIMPAPVYIRPVNITMHVFRQLFMRERSQNEVSVKCIPKREAGLSSDRQGLYEFRFEEIFDDWTDDLWRRCRHQHRLWVIRDKSYLNWRYVQRPENKYRIISIWHGNSAVGYAVITFQKKRFGKILFILDFLVDVNYQGAGYTLINKIIELSKIGGAILTSALVTPKSQYRKLFHQHLFFPLPEKMFPQPLFFGAFCFKTDLNRIVFDPSAWFISWGDNDVV